MTAPLLLHGFGCFSVKQSTTQHSSRSLEGGCRRTAAVLQAAASGEENAERLADAAVRDWNPFGAKPN